MSGFCLEYIDVVSIKPITTVHNVIYYAMSSNELDPSIFANGHVEYTPPPTTTKEPVTSMRLAIEDFLAYEAQKSDPWEQEVYRTIGLIDNAILEGRIPADPHHVVRQLDLMSTIHSFTATSARSPQPAIKLKRPLLDFPERFSNGEVDRDNWFNQAITQAKEGDWRPFLDYFDKFIRPNMYFALETNFGFSPDAGIQSTTEEDIAQIVLMRVAQHFQRLDFPNSYMLQGWCRRVALNEAVNISRKKPPFEELSLEEMLIGDEDLPVVLTDLMGSDRERARTIRSAILKLDSEEQRQVLILKYFCGYSNRTVGAILQKNEGAIKSLQHRAQAQLGKIISRRYINRL